MKFGISVAIGLLTLGVNVQAEETPIWSCKATKIMNDSILKESLSLEEYPEISISADGEDHTATIGINRYSAADGDKIGALETANLDSLYEIVTSGSEVFRFHQPFCGDKKCEGTLSTEKKSARGDSVTVEIAKFMCE